MWWSLISTWLRLRRTVPGYSITGQYILSLTDKFAAFSWNCIITKAYVTSKIASYSRDMQCLLWTTSVWSLQTALIYKTRWIAAQSSILLQDESVSTDLNFFKMFILEGWHAFVFKHSGFKNFHLLWTLNVELLIDISGSFIVLLIFRIIFSVLFQVLLSVLPLVTFVPYFFIYIRPIASRTMLLLRREECCEVFCRLF